MPTLPYGILSVSLLELCPLVRKAGRTWKNRWNLRILIYKSRPRYFHRMPKKASFLPALYIRSIFPEERFNMIYLTVIVANNWSTDCKGCQGYANRCSNNWKTIPGRASAPCAERAWRSSLLLMIHPIASSPPVSAYLYHNVEPSRFLSQPRLYTIQWMEAISLKVACQPTLSQLWTIIIDFYSQTSKLCAPVRDERSFRRIILMYR